MVQRSFYVRACWDDDAKVYYTESDIIGLHVEAETLEEFQEVTRDLAAELIMANHVTAAEMTSTPLRDLIPSIFWETPEANKGELASA